MRSIAWIIHSVSAFLYHDYTLRLAFVAPESRSVAVDADALPIMHRITQERYNCGNDQASGRPFRRLHAVQRGDSLPDGEPPRHDFR